MLLTIQHTQLTTRDFVGQAGEIFAVFDARTQDSGNVSYGIAGRSGRFFVKTAGSESGPATVLPHTSRIALLRNSIELHRSLSHPVLPALHNVIECSDGPALVFDWVEGELLGSPQSERLNPVSAYRQFRSLPPGRILPVLDQIIDLHFHLAAHDWIAVDFYDGSLLYDFSTEHIHVVDLDHYHRGPFVNRMGRMFGSTRFMAPEEFELGATIDQCTTVFVLGRTIHELLSGHSPEALGRAVALLDVADRACQPNRAARFPTVEVLHGEWNQARSRTA